MATLWNPKARKWLRGRKGIFGKIKSSIRDSSAQIVWIHCSSLGEFEQGRPVIDRVKAQYPGCKFLVTFFSPSGYEVRKNYAGVDHVFYLPMDSRGNAKEFLDIVDPSLVIFVKYDYWYHYLNEIKQKKINCLLISAVFRRDQSFFKWHGSLQRKMLRCFTQILVQNQESKALLETIGIEHAVVAGDTRFDTVTDNARSFEPIPIVENFLGMSKCIVAGSTWSKDETHLQQAFAELGNSNFKLVVAPHQIDQSHLDKLKKLFPRSIKFSELISGPKSYSNNVLVIDNVGMLSRLYRYAHIAYVGGGFTKDGVHNVLEAAVFGKPVIFGNNYKKYREAIDLVGCGGASSFSDDRALRQLLGILFHDEKEYKEKCQASRKYVELNTGATRKIVAYIEENRLLTS